MAHLGDSSGLLIVNPHSGDGSGPDADELAREAESRGITVHILREGDDAAAVARNAQGPVGAAGGDGSLGAVAEVALERDVPFVCIPFGTRNHFARDIGLDRNDPIGALGAFGSAREQRIDVGRVAGRIFLNNVSFGVYAHLVHRREHHRRRRDSFARLRALWLSVQDRHPQPFVLDGDLLAARVVLVANNAYEVSALDLGARERLDEGHLHAYVAEGWLPHTWDERSGARFTLEQRGGLRAAIDGEPAHLESPVELTVEPRALRILLPVSPRHVPATQAELSRIGLLAELPGEQLFELAKRMRREDVAGGEAPVVEGDKGDRFYVILNGLFAVSNFGTMPRRMLRPGDYFGEVALAMDVPRTANVRALTTATVASCDKDTFDQFLRPLFADDN